MLGEVKKKLFICSPVDRESYAGWLFQIRRYAERNQSRAEICFIFDTNSSKNNGLQRALRFALRAQKIIRESREGSIVLFPVFFLPNMLTALLLPRRVSYVVRISGGELSPGNFLSFRLRKALLRRAKAVIVLNSHAIERLTALGVPRGVFAPNAVSQVFRPPTVEERLNARQCLGLSPDSVVIGHVGTLCRRKQQLLLISAAKKCAINKIEVLLCGPYSGHPEADPDYLDLCRKSAIASGIRLVATGQLDDVLQAYWAMDIFAFPSLSEGMPNALLEAMACGLPCLATDIPGSRDIIQSGKSGLLVPLASPEEFITRLVELMADCDERQRFADEAYARVVAVFSSKSMDEAYSNVLGLTK